VVAARIRPGNAWVAFAVGAALALGYVLLAYVTAPPDYQHSHGESEAGMFLGRWWEPQWTVFVAVFGYASWAVGTVAALLLRASAPGSKHARQRAS
jgi:hypothetical protein